MNPEPAGNDKRFRKVEDSTADETHGTEQQWSLH